MTGARSVLSAPPVHASRYSPDLPVTATIVRTGLIRNASRIAAHMEFLYFETDVGRITLWRTGGTAARRRDGASEIQADSEPFFWALPGSRLLPQHLEKQPSKSGCPGRQRQ